MITPEGRVKKQIRDWLRAEGAYVFSPVQQGYGQQSLDLLVCWKGKFVAIEVKTAIGYMTRRQTLIKKEIEDKGGYAFVARSLGEVISQLSYLDKPVCQIEVISQLSYLDKPDDD